MIRSFIIVLFSIFLIQGCGSGSSAAVTNSTTDKGKKTSVLLPLYVYPTKWNKSDELSVLISATDGLFIAIINPSNGPDTSQNKDYVDGIEYLYLQNVKVIAYVYTSYTKRDKQDIYDDIDAYVNFYGIKKLSGIFFDEVSLQNIPEESYMKDISEYAKAKGLDFIVLNPGTSVNQKIIDENYYDIIVTYENPYEKYVKFTNSLTSGSKTKQSLLVYNYPNLSSYQNEIQKAKDMNFDYLYFTIDTDPNPWDTVFNFLK